MVGIATKHNRLDFHACAPWFSNFCFSSDACGQEYYWIGLRDSLNEAEFVWEDTEEVATYMSWAPCEPNDSSDGEDCAELRQSFGYDWNDSACSKTSGAQFAVCEKHK